MEQKGSPAAYPLSAYVFTFLGITGLTFLYALYTDAAWEDWYIAYRSAKNLAAGHGLVFQPGEYVHSFTSPLGVLVPAALSWLWGASADAAVLWSYRLIGCVLLGLVGVLLLDWARWCRWSFWPAALLIGLVALESKLHGFAVSGMETPFVLFFLALSLYAMVADLPRRALVLGLGWGGLMWSRPDGAITIAAMGLGLLVANARPQEIANRLHLLWLIIRAGLVCTVVYLPWFLWAWSYYGSPVPHTVVAKSLYLAEGSTLEGFAIVGLFPIISLFGTTSLDANLSPAYVLEGGWHPAITLVSRYLSWLACMAWVIPAFDRRLRAVSFMAFAGLAYLSALVPTAFPWYFPPVTLLSVIVLAGLLQECLRRLPQSSAAVALPLKRVARGSAIILLLATLALSIAAAYTTQTFRAISEKEHRRQIGLWLAQQATPKDTVFVECLGYIGFFSQLKIFDYPGLASPKVVAERRKLDAEALDSESYGHLIQRLHPDWVILRPHERRDVQRDVPRLLEEHFELIRTFSTRDRLDAIGFLPGRPGFHFDSVFEVYRAKGKTPTAPVSF